MRRRERLQQRSARFGVGKEIGGNVYVHRAYEHVLPTNLLDTAKRRLPTDFRYTVVKYNLRTGDLSFVESPDFDSVPEPTIGKIYAVKRTGAARMVARSNTNIYHHKWLFVADDYQGFDVEASKRRSLAWIGLERVDRQRIGQKAYWEQCVVPRIPEL